MQHATPHTLNIGAATVTIINVGDMMFDLAEALNISESDWRPQYGTSFEERKPYPSQSIHIALPGASILVDANDYALSVPPGSDFYSPDYQPPPGLVEQLRALAIHAEDITHLIITHAHFDHYVGTTIQDNGSYVPRFPNARVLLGRADWDEPETQEALQNPDSTDSHTFGVLHKLGLLELVDGNRDLAPEVRIIAAPGESPGHQIVRVHSQGQTFYCLGDLCHHAVELEHPTWMVQWTDAEANLASRRALIEAALAENALLVAAHMPFGRLEGTASNPRWVPS